MGINIGVSAAGELGAREGVKCVFIVNFIFLLILIFHCGGGVGGEFAISQLIWGNGVSGSRILGGSIGGISVGCIGGQGWCQL